MSSSSSSSSSSSQSANGAVASSSRFPDAFAVVDPISTGANLAFEIARRGYPVISVLSGHLNAALLHLVDATVKINFAANIEHDPKNPNFDDTINALKALPYTILAVVSGSEPGVELTDVLTSALGLPGNGTLLSAARRDKYLMGETVRQAGVRAVKQARIRTWEDVEAFIKDLNQTAFKVVIKPIKSAGSDSVYLCESLTDLRSKFDHIIGHNNQLGQLNDAAVLQEFLTGVEYVVDSVTRNGEHKIIALWEYDKRSVHGVHFVYFGMRSVAGHTAIGTQLIEYQKRVLSALGIQNGAGHGEVIMTATGPCLVEVGARCHGAEGTFMPLADVCWKRNQVGALIDSVMPSVTAWSVIPEWCDIRETGVTGFKVDLVCAVAGTLKSYRHLDEIRALPSFMRFDLLPEIGAELKVTIDCFTAVGSVTLSNKDEAQLDKDVEKIRELEKTMFVI